MPCNCGRESPPRVRARLSRRAIATRLLADPTRTALRAAAAGSAFRQATIMLRSTQGLEHYAIGATDGDIGHVKDFYFGDDAWRDQAV